ncbi:ribonuclease P protein component 3 [uncultured Methanobacterium sp.]|uniref:ribonuclease P protein component 3 n=1 Tax=uncultured Methanobacterium sp. TaxID=176306 RepID=UPI002AA69BC7|nr:RNase P subunit p30 family protein [uncultured Methanobacterium sp.]
MFFDFHIHGGPELALDAGNMGYHGVGLTVYSRDCINKPETLKNLRKSISDLNADKDDHISIQICVEIEAKNQEDLKKQVQKFRKKADVILVHGGDLKINRAATEDPRVDILSHPYRSRFDSGINHVLAVKAAENSVAIEINLKYFLLTRPNQQYRVLNQFRQIMKLHRKYEVPVIITSDTSSFYGLRNPRDIVALAACFGMTKDEAFNALSKTPQEIIYRNKIRDDVVVPGARLVK